MNINIVVKMRAIISWAVVIAQYLFFGEQSKRFSISSKMHPTFSLRSKCSFAMQVAETPTLSDVSLLKETSRIRNENLKICFRRFACGQVVCIHRRSRATKHAPTKTMESSQIMFLPIRQIFPRTNNALPNGVKFTIYQFYHTLPHGATGTLTQ